MRAGVRYWMMLAVLAAAIAGMALMSHGEATPAALPLAQFPKQIGNYCRHGGYPF